MNLRTVCHNEKLRKNSFACFTGEKSRSSFFLFVDEFFIVFATFLRIFFLVP